MTPNPIVRFRRWMREAAEAGVELCEAVALATADERGRPSVRFVLLKDVDERGFVFYTNARSAKGRELARNPRAALAVYWHQTGKQVRVDGRVTSVSAADADRYWTQRPRDSQLAARASQQSRTVSDRATLERAYRLVRERYEGRDVPRPPHWTGYRLVPRRIEFWTRREPRLHHRELFVRQAGGWRRTLLQP
jgi:pyridoxamine 5'-phosphate oxidase